MKELSAPLKEYLDHHFNSINGRLDRLRRIIMANQADLDAALASEDQGLTDLATKLQGSLDDLTAAVEQGKTGADLQAEVDKVNAHVSQLSAFAASAVAADPGATPAPTA